MLRIIMYLWPVIIPALVYFAWFIWAKKRAGEGDPLRWHDGPWLYAVFATFFIAFACFGFLIFLDSQNTGDSYIPAEFKDGILVPEP